MAWYTVIIVLCASLSDAWCFEAEISPPSEYCAELGQQNNLDIRQLLGGWYGVEFVTHRNQISPVKPYDSCIFIEIDDLDEPVSVRLYSEFLNRMEIVNVCISGHLGSEKCDGSNESTDSIEAH